MGQIKELSCKCGYTKKVFVGVGLMGISEKMIRKSFATEELKPFDNARENNMVKSFIIENTKAYCPACNDIFTLPTLKYKVGDIESIIKKGCPECGGSTTATSICPGCGRPLSEKEVGHWD